MIDDLPTEEEAKRILFAVDWFGPWERLEGFFFGVRQDGTFRWEVREDPPSLLNRLGTYANARDFSWRHRHVSRGTKSWRIWRRRG